MAHVVCGLVLIVLGVWGLYDEYYYVLDLVKGGGPVVLMLLGLVAMLAGIVSPKPEGESDNDRG